MDVSVVKTEDCCEKILCTENSPYLEGTEVMAILTPGSAICGVRTAPREGAGQRVRRACAGRPPASTLPAGFLRRAGHGRAFPGILANERDHQVPEGVCGPGHPRPGRGTTGCLFSRANLTQNEGRGVGRGAGHPARPGPCG